MPAEGPPAGLGLPRGPDRAIDVGVALAGFNVSKASPWPRTQEPSMYNPNSRACSSSQAWAGPPASGAGPYAMDWNISGMDAMQFS
jgi:hypothetical protein